MLTTLRSLRSKKAKKGMNGLKLFTDAMEFRVRDYSAEEAGYLLPRMPTDSNPLSAESPSLQVVIDDHEKNDIFDPLREPAASVAPSIEATQDVPRNSIRGTSNEAVYQSSVKEWSSFKRSLMQKFSVTKTISISSVSDVIVKRGKALEKSSTSVHLEELDDPQKLTKEDVKVISRQEYISRLHELKDEIGRSWRVDDRVTSLKLSIKVARLLMETCILQFYPTLFVLVTDVMDMLGNMVWERIKRRAEYADDGTRICTLPENFKAADVCSDAKETCNNWFCKIGSIRELLPRIYLELAIFRCWRFLHDRPWENLQRLVTMMRGLADPLASMYCRLYMAYCAQKLHPIDAGYLVTCINDTRILVMRITSGKDTMQEHYLENKKLLVSLMEPTIEWIMKCTLKDVHLEQVDNIFVELGLRGNLSMSSGSFPCISIVLYHLLKELPAEVVSSSVLEILQLIECSKDFSFDQYLNYRLLGLKLCERKPQMDCIESVLDKVFEVVSHYDGLEEYLEVIDAYLDIILQCHMDNYLSIILDGIAKRACSKEISEKELGSLQSIFIKILVHFNDLKDVFALNHFLEILDVMHGSPRNVVNIHILNKATRNGYVRDPTTIQFLFEISQALHNGIELSTTKGDEFQQVARLISRFVQMVDYGEEIECQLTFLIECRGAFSAINELKETLVHSSNYLAIKAMKDGNKLLNFVKSCIAFCEVTIPSVSDSIKQMNLYLETAEVALLGGLFSHTDGLIDSAICSLQSLDLSDGSRMLVDLDGILSSVRKLCSFLVMVPGNPELGDSYIPGSIFSLLSSQSWTPRLRIRTICAVVSLSATLSQKKLPYHANNGEVLGNDQLFFGDTSYHQKLTSISSSVLQDLLDGLQQEPYRAARGSMALEACNCIASSFRASEISQTCCYKLIEIAESCLNANDKYLRSTANFIDKQFSTSSGKAQAITI